MREADGVQTAISNAFTDTIIATTLPKGKGIGVRELDGRMMAGEEGREEGRDLSYGCDDWLREGERERKRRN